MANTDENEAPGDVELRDRQTPVADPPAPPNVLEQARLGNLHLFRAALESGNHPLDFRPERGQCPNRTPLHLAAMEGHKEIVDFILSHRAICREVVNAKDCFGYTALHLAVRHSRENVVRLLTMSSLVLPDRFLAATSELDDLRLNCGGYTPLHLAAVSGHIAITKLLLRQPCQVEFAYDPVNIFASSWRDSTPVDLARQKKFWVLANVLEASDSNWLQQERARFASAANAVQVGAALVAAASFSTWLQPPGGIPNPYSGSPSPSPSAQNSSLNSEKGFIFLFYLFVTCAFALSVESLVLGIFATFPYTNAFSYRSTFLKVDLGLLRRILHFSRTCLLAALLNFTFAFAAAGAIVIDKVSTNESGRSVRLEYFFLCLVLNLVVAMFYLFTRN